MEWYSFTIDETVEKLAADLNNGLSTEEAVQRQARYGSNELVERGTKPPWRILLDQFKEIMVIILIIAAIVSGILGEYVEVIVILAIVILNAILGFVQEYRAEQAMTALKKMSVPTVRIRRDRRVQEKSSIDLVPGDIVLLEAGNLVPADCRVLEAVGLKTQEAALTGESEPVSKQNEAIEGENLQIGDQRNMIFMGTIVTYGRGTGIVTATGMQTELGNIADLIQGVEDEQTPLQRRLDHLGKTLAWIALVIIALVVILGLIRPRNANTELL